MSSVAAAPYTQEISRATPAFFLFLIDQSFSMEEPIGGAGPRKCEAVANTINTWLENLIIRATGSGGIKDYMHLGVLGYRTVDDPNNPAPIIESALSPPLTEIFNRDGFVRISEVAQHQQTKQLMMNVYDEETGEDIQTPVEKPSWVEPVREGGTPMCTALYQAYQLVEKWINTGDNRRCFPPIVVHLTDGEAMDGDPVPYAQAIHSLATDNGNVLMFNCHLSMNAADKIMFPSSREILADPYAPVLFEMSSELPEPIFNSALNEGFPVQPHARGFVFNADAVALVQFLDIGTRVAKSNLR